MSKGVARIYDQGEADVTGDPAGSFQHGDWLPRGVLSIATGHVRLVFDAGAEVQVQSPAKLELLGPNYARLAQGRISCRVPDAAYGFRIDTPLEGQENGKSYGGYAGLSVRFKWEAEEIQVNTERGPIEEWSKEGRYGGKAWSMDYSARLGGKTGGIAILEHPGNLDAPTTWYAIDAKMKYFGPAVIYQRPYTLETGQSMTLKYRVCIHDGRWNAALLRSKSAEFKGN